tara:strand:- start:5422 stop:6261 length:840 start_codon:yes stop_codon:yes gene_type:complete
MDSRSRSANFWVISMMCVVMLLMPLFASAQSPAKNKKSPVAKGGLVLKYETPKKEIDRKIKALLKHDGTFDAIVKSLNQEFNFPETVRVKFVANEGPLYDTRKKELVMSYGFINYLASLYIERYPETTDDAMIDFALRSNFFLFYHEIAHALIDVFNLPIVSNEETAADNFAVILALEMDSEGFDVVMDSVELFDILDQTNTKQLDESDYWDEHSLDAQRFYNILCMTYGRFPEKVKAAVKKIKDDKLNKFIENKGEYCLYLYDQQTKAWLQLLNPHFK